MSSASLGWAALQRVLTKTQMGVPWWFVALKEPRERRIRDSESLHSFLEAGFFLWLLWIRVLEEGLGAPLVVKSWQDPQTTACRPYRPGLRKPKSESTCEGTTQNFPERIQLCVIKPCGVLVPFENYWFTPFSLEFFLAFSQLRFPRVALLGFE